MKKIGFSNWFNNYSSALGKSVAINSFSKGRRDAHKKVLKDYPFVQISEILDFRTCDLCKIMDGKIMDCRKEAYQSGKWTPQYHTNCFVNGAAKIYTSKGWIKIRDVKIGDLVLTHKGRFRKVINTFRESCCWDKTVKLSLKKGWKSPDLLVTLEHPVLVEKENGRKVWRKAGNIKVGDKVKYLALGICEYCGEPTIEGKKTCSDKCWRNLALKNGWDPKKSRDRRKKMGKKAKRYWKNLSSEEMEKKRNASWLKKAQEKTREMIKNGTHHFVNSRREEIMKKSHSKCAKFSHRGSYLEKIMEYCFKKRGIDYKRSYRIKKPKNFKLNRESYWWVDFALPDKKIAIECDGEYWHSSPEAIIKDKFRQNGLESKGWTVLRFSGNEIRKSAHKCIDEVERVLANHNKKYKFISLPIKSVVITSKRKKPFMRFNLEVEEDNSFIAARGFAVHNCRGMEVYISKDEKGVSADFDGFKRKGEIDAYLKVAHLKKIFFGRS